VLLSMAPDVQLLQLSTCLLVLGTHLRHLKITKFNKKEFTLRFSQPVLHENKNSSKPSIAIHTKYGVLKSHVTLLPPCVTRFSLKVFVLESSSSKPLNFLVALFQNFSRIAAQGAPLL
jgi:hypothetical protein